MRYLSIGEPLVEFSSRPDAPSTFDRRAGGDTLNTAIYLARLAGAGQVGYLSCLGDDTHSRWLRNTIAAEGVDVSLLAEREGARPGLSFISTDITGERSFTYWREQAPFRRHFDDGSRINDLQCADRLFLSGVALAVLNPEGREKLLQALEQRCKQGAQVIFDTNYRPALWPDVATARAVIARAIGIATLLLPSLDDLSACFDATDPDEAMRLLITMSDAEMVLTTGGGSILHRASRAAHTESHRLPPAVAALDTTGAGDSFNAAWLVARDQGLSAADSIAAAARLAAEVVRHPGAIIPKGSMPDLFVQEVMQ